MNARLMPTAMHPWMDPRRETVLWDDDDRRLSHVRPDLSVAAATDGRICRACTSTCRSPTTASSRGCMRRSGSCCRCCRRSLRARRSPKALPPGSMDYRLDAYSPSARRTPSVAGEIIPDTVESRAEYEARILAPMYAEIAPHDPAGVLRHEWLNSRGAIRAVRPQRDRNPAGRRAGMPAGRCVDRRSRRHRRPMAVCGAARHRSSISRRWKPARWRACCARRSADAEAAVVDDAGYLRALGIRADRCSAGDVWRALLDACARDASLASTWWQPAIDVILRRGPLARRILRATGERPSRRNCATSTRCCATACGTAGCSSRLARKCAATTVQRRDHRRYRLPRHVRAWRQSHSVALRAAVSVARGAARVPPRLRPGRARDGAIAGARARRTADDVDGQPACSSSSIDRRAASSDIRPSCTPWRATSAPTSAAGTTRRTGSLPKRSSAMRSRAASACCTSRRIRSRRRSTARCGARTSACSTTPAANRNARCALPGSRRWPRACRDGRRGATIRIAERAMASRAICGRASRDASYCGIELEINQKHVRDGYAIAARERAAVVAALRDALASFR